MKDILLRMAASLLLPASLAACAIIPDSPNVSGNPMPEGTAVGLGQPVTVGTVVVTPMRVIEDSRCPTNAQCVWAGRLIVETRIDGAGWRDTAPITLGETYGTHDRVIALVTAAPDKTTGAETEPGSYRFSYMTR